MVIIDRRRKSCNFCFKVICGPRVNNSGKCLILFVTVLFIGEEWLRLLTLIKTSLSRQFCYQKLLQISKDTFQ